MVASLHLSRGSNLLWVQQQGGWTSPAVLLRTYTHFLPTEIGGYADVLASPDGTIRHRDPCLHRGSRSSRAFGTVLTPVGLLARRRLPVVTLAWRRAAPPRLSIARDARGECAALADLAVRDYLILESVDAWILEQSKLVKSKSGTGS